MTEVMVVVVSSSFDCFLHRCLDRVSQRESRGAVERKQQQQALLLDARDSRQQQREWAVTREKRTHARNCTLSLFSATHHPVAALTLLKPPCY